MLSLLRGEPRGSIHAFCGRRVGQLRRLLGEVRKHVNSTHVRGPVQYRPALRIDVAQVSVALVAEIDDQIGTAALKHCSVEHRHPIPGRFLDVCPGLDQSAHSRHVAKACRLHVRVVARLLQYVGALHRLALDLVPARPRRELTLLRAVHDELALGAAPCGGGRGLLRAAVARDRDRGRRLLLGLLAHGVRLGAARDVSPRAQRHKAGRGSIAASCGARVAARRGLPGCGQGLPAAPGKSQILCGDPIGCPPSVLVTW